MVMIKGILALIFVIGSLTIGYNYSPRAFCFLAVVLIIQLIFEIIGE